MRWREPDRPQFGRVRVRAQPPKPLVKLCVVPDPVVAGVVRISADAALPRPHYGILGSVHGDERCGRLALAALRAEAETGTLGPLTGTLVLVHGNLAATEVGLRYTDGGVDLNRLFRFDFERELAVADYCPEHHRAIALRPVLDELDAAVDLHSAASPTDAFAIAIPSEGSLDLAQKLGMRHVTHRWEGPAAIGDRVALARLGFRGKPAVAIECGQHATDEADAEALHVAKRFLVATGALAGVAPANPAVLLEVVAALPQPSKAFRFDRPIRGLDALARGQVLGRDGERTVSVDYDCVAVLPNDRVPVGKPMIYLARLDPN